MAGTVVRGVDCSKWELSHRKFKISNLVDPARKPILRDTSLNFAFFAYFELTLMNQIRCQNLDGMNLDHLLKCNHQILK